MLTVCMCKSEVGIMFNTSNSKRYLWLTEPLSKRKSHIYVFEKSHVCVQLLSCPALSLHNPHEVHIALPSKSSFCHACFS